MNAITPPVLNALTVDVEDYFHVQAFADVLSPDSWDTMQSRVERNTAVILDMLDKHGRKATFFILGWEAKRRPGLVRAIAQAGHEVACHGYGHQLIYRIGPDAFRQDVLQAKGLLEDILGVGVRGYRAPSYSITAKSLWALDILVQVGFTYDSSIVPARHDFYGLPAAPRHPYRILTDSGELTEFPPSTMRLGFGKLGTTLPVGGGGYLRLYPLALTRWGLKRINQHEGMPASIYIHPWEIDARQPRLDGSLRSRFRHYINLERAAYRLDGLLKELHLAPMCDVIENSASFAPHTVRDNRLQRVE